MIKIKYAKMIMFASKWICIENLTYKFMKTKKDFSGSNFTNPLSQLPNFTLKENFNVKLMKKESTKYLKNIKLRKNKES